MSYFCSFPNALYSVYFYFEWWKGKRFIFGKKTGFFD
ncbi:hypothetical protein CPATCC_0026040 [Cryptosporidium parvum]|uniref:Uncharacterized protein n=1 Tax=Cryptosporidium parvum TaxID=5807 RepID=A0A7S7LHW9_CRYPV|nr:hypothetical protein CPATCC_0026040 [Cryptosporidium parvum]|eukprot:QOY41852.1 hypothetical protein CPATCC_002455 [Cryptosporidium parvum]